MTEHPADYLARIAQGRHRRRRPWIADPIESWAEDVNRERDEDLRRRFGHDVMIEPAPKGIP